ncbi:hypothetical protein BDR26DRAFT_874578 [Obelidium mucronatum]|nr:hypothetical protein BDR26DRAFT_874578 [Obelidium mucronatum]
MTPRSSISSNISITVPIDALKDATPSGIAATTKKPPTASAPQISNIDVRDMFPQDFLYASKQEGLNSTGHFCIADCYVIISTTTDDPHLQHYNTTTTTPTNQQEPDEISADHLIHTIYTWIVGVKNLLGIGSRVIRQAQNEESKEFIGLEGQDLVGEEKAGIIYDDESYAAESGLFIAERRMFQLRVYRVSGKPRVRMTLVEPARKSLESCNVYLIDGGHDLIQWNGKESCLTVRTKCRMLMSIINGSDRVGKAFLLEIEEGEESEKLEKILPRDSVGQDDHLNPESFVAMIYKIPEGPIGEMNDVLIAKDENDAGFSQTILDAQECCILDAGVEIYLWIGSKATAAKKCFAPEVLARVIRSQPTRPSYLSLQRITQHNEPESFKLYFSDWIEQRTQQHIHQTRVSLLNRPTPLKVDVRALYAPHPLLLRLVAYNAFSFERGRFVKLETVERGGVHLCMEGQYVFLCVYRGEGEADQDGPQCGPQPTEVSDAMNKALVLSGAEEFRLGGTQFPCFSEKTFRFHARHELEEAIRKMYHCSVQIVHVSQEREPLELLAHWGNRSVVHRGTRKALLKRLKPASSGNEAEESGLPKSVLYHIRTDWKYKTTRAIQVPCVAERLISRDCFYIHELGSDPGVGFLWTGKNSTAEDARKALAVCDRISSFIFREQKYRKGNQRPTDENGSNLSLNKPLQELSLKPSVSKQQNTLTKQFRIVGEGLEPRAYFQLFPNGKQPYCTAVFNRKSILLGTSVIPTNLPRLLICSCVKGYFTDPGPHSPVYLWNGSSASDVAVEVWLETLDDGRRNWEGEMATGESVVDGVVSVREGAEGYEFRALFHAWIQMDK